MTERLERYRDLAVFVTVVELGGFTAAGRALGASVSQTSRAVARLEDQLGVRLLNRSTRRVTPTEAGRLLHEQAGALLSDLDAITDAVADTALAPHGTLRVTLPVRFGGRYVAPLAAAFAAQHEGVRFSLSFDDRKVDLIAEGYDLAVRVGQLDDSSLIARRLGSSRLLTVASPSYLAAHGTPRTPADLASHELLVYAHDAAPQAWRFERDGVVETVRAEGRFTANNGEGLLAAALAGLGVARLPDAILADAVHCGQVRSVLREWDTLSPIWALYPPGRHLALKVRHFVDFLVEALAPAPWMACYEEHARRSLEE